MKNYPNQASSFERIRATLAVIEDLNQNGHDPTLDEGLGYACAERGVYTFRSMGTNPTPPQVRARIALERLKPPASQGVRTFARELRRTLRDLGWIDSDAALTAEGQALLASASGSVDEQGLLVEGLMKIVVANKDGSDPHHPVPVLLKLLAAQPSHHREGLELAFEPRDDSDAEFQRVLKLYPLPRDKRIQAIGTTTSQRANAVKILPTLSVAAGLVVEDDDGFFSLSQDGWQLLGQPPTTTTGRAAKEAIAKRGRRTTVGKLVTSKTIAKRRNDKPPRTLTPEEQARAAEKLKERTDAHQALVARMAVHIGDGDGEFFEDEFSYDMLWVAYVVDIQAFLFEMKTITGTTDAHARVRAAVGQLSYYEYFHAAPRLKGRGIQRVVVVDADLPEELKDYLTHENIAAISYLVGATPVGLNPLGVKVLGLLP